MNTSILPPAPLAAAGAWLRAVRWRKPLLAFATPLLLLAAFERLVYSPLGSDWLILLDWVVFALAGGALLAAGLLLVEAHEPRLRRDALRALGVPLLFVAGTVLGVQACKPIRTQGWERIAARGDRLVGAIEAFETTHGAPPVTLSGLAPGFIAALPGTGLGSHPDFRYEVSYGKPGEASFRLWSGLPGIRHEVDFEYLPAGDVEAWHTVVKRVGNWVVVAND